MMPAPQSSRQFVRGNQAKTSSLMQRDDSALKPQGTDDQPALEVLNYSSPDDAIMVNESCHTSQANLLQRGERDRGSKKNVSAACQSALPVRQIQADLGRDLQTSLEAKSGTADMAHLHPTDKTEAVQSTEPPAQSIHKIPHPVHNTDPKPGIPVPTWLSKFKEMGTMTVQPESSFTQETVSRTWRDAEVQAVATVESKSASTSPSILAAFLKGNPPPEEKEELHIIHQVGMGLSQAALTDSLSSQQKAPCSPGITSKSTVVMAVTASAQTQPVKLPGVPSDMVSPVSPDNAKTVLPFSPTTIISQGTCVSNTEMTSVARDGKDVAQVPVDAPVPPEPIPVEQFAVDSTNQTPSQSETAGEPSTTSPDAVTGTENSMQDLVHDVGSSQLALLRSRDSEVKQKEGPGSSETKPVQSKGVSQGEAIPNQSVVKPKKENSVVLDLKGGKHVSSQPAAVHVEACLEDAVERESRGQGDTGQSQTAGGQNLKGGLMPELSVSSAGLAFPVAALATPQQQGLQARESRHELNTAVIPASAQALLNLGENKKQPTPVMEAKVQVKQSKHIRDVVWDEQGMTWEVYGASLDPESLGIAIQNHLQRQIREHEKLIQARNSQTRKSISSDTSSNKKLKGRQHSMFQSMLQNFRRPNCCIRPAPSSVLD